MKKRSFGIYIVILGMLAITAFAVSSSMLFSYADVELSEEELEWLEEHKEITYAGDPSWPPVDFVNEEGVLSGLSIDFLDLVGKRIGIEFIKINVGNWDETVKSIERKEIDIISASYSEERLEYMLFTPEYYNIPYVYVVRNDFKGNIEYEDVKNLKVGTISGWILSEKLRENHEGVKLIEYLTVSDALQAVSFGNVDVMIQEIASVSYEIEKNNITNLRSAGNYPDSVDIRFAIREDYDVLTGIISKVISDMTESEKKDIISKWVRFNETPFYRTIEFRNIVYGFISFVLMVLFWNYILNKKVKDKTYELSLALKRSEDMQLQLENSIEDLNNMQSELVNQEKLASLGSMVAGISHEINNPLGVCLTTVSTLESKASKIVKSYSDGKMTKSELEAFIGFSNECSQMLRQNIDHAINLLDGFKTLAVNQAYDTKLVFNVCEYLRVLSDNVKYELKKKRATIDIKCYTDVSINSYPGAFSQIFTNLIKNSLLHGFSSVDGNNQISINVTKEESTLIINYKDNGIGIEKENIEDIFKMFYTTKRGKGGSGLGLHIISNLLSEKFNGSITCESEIGKGVSFDIKFDLEYINSCDSADEVL